MYSVFVFAVAALGAHSKLLVRDYSSMVKSALSAKRLRKMTDLTPPRNDGLLQPLVNTWTDGSYSAVHSHNNHSEIFAVLDGALAFFLFDETGTPSSCEIIGPEVAMLVVSPGQYHAMTAAPKYLGYPGHAIALEASAHP